MNSKLFTFLCTAIATLMLDASDCAITCADCRDTSPSDGPKRINASMEATLKSLRDTKAANEEILKKQQATLEALDELQKAADQIKIFSKRG